LSQVSATEKSQLKLLITQLESLKIENKELKLNLEAHKELFTDYEEKLKEKN